MKTKKIVSGALVAAMLSLPICSLATAVAADGTVQIAVSDTTAEAGGQFTVDVSLADVPTTGIAILNFSLKYDSSLITIDSVSAGAVTKTGAEDADGTASGLSLFDSYLDGDGFTTIIWTTGLEDSKYWITGDGVFATVSGTVAEGVDAGTVAKIEVVPVDRETYDSSGVKNDLFDCGYPAADGSAVRYDVDPVAGKVTIGGAGTTTYGDANEDGNVNVADAVAVLQYIANSEKYDLTEQAKENADCDGTLGITGNDAVVIQQVDAKLIARDDLPCAPVSSN